MASFYPTDWIQKNIKYSSRLPRTVRRAATKAVAIPELLETELSKHVTLHGLITLQLPLIQDTKPAFRDIMSKFFSLESPSPPGNHFLTQVLHFPVPDEKTVNILHDSLRQAISIYLEPGRQILGDFRQTSDIVCRKWPKICRWLT